MFEGRSLSEVTYKELLEFLQEGNEEGTRLDYKEGWVADAPKVACSFANTSGGLLVVGVKEKRGPNNEKLKIPDPNDVPGLKPKDWEAAAADAIRSRTRPGVTPKEVAALRIPGNPDGRMVLLIRVEESMDAPHEVHVSSTPEIPVRRGDNTEAAGLDDVERMIYRRDRIRNDMGEPLVPEFFQGVIGPNQFHDPNTSGYPQVVAISLRSRRAASLRFDFSSELDDKILELAMRHQFTKHRTLRPTSSGVRVREGNTGTPRIIVEVRKNGTIAAARALKTDAKTRRVSSGGTEEVEQERRLYFSEIAEILREVARFAAGAYTLLGRTGEEMEVVFGFSGCESHVALFEEYSGQGPYSGEMTPGPYLRQQQYAYAILAPDRTTGEIPAEQLRKLLRDASRFFGVSVPDDHFRRYVR